ncbi:MAG: helix-hairpin-helix domain-containing protein [Candidatus Limnocylindrales bacterium]
MTDPTFDWHTLDAAQPAPEPAARTARPTRLMLVAAVTVLGLVTAAAGAYLALTAPDPSLLIDGAGAAAFLPQGSQPLDSGGVSGGVGGGVSGGTIVVDVEGAVAHPGVVRLPPGSRVGDAIAAAGGFGALLDVRASSALNLAALATDGMQILVPVRGAASTAGQPGSVDAPGSTSTLDLNTATEAQLDALPGIGPATAAKILAARSEARFVGVDDLQSRKLVGPATFEKIRGLVRVGG